MFQTYFWKLQHHDSVLWWWEHTLKQSIGNLVSKRRRNRKKPIYIGVADWTLLEAAWGEVVNKNKSQTNSQNRSSNADRLGIYRHVSG
ncbi:unnamed protein product [Thlaspi arvense]|uniref:Uncharacterized protein n=1 Tax=Thlaspi arvense TaxID=13288 RepID=A0AAU9T532_THLAR|nr:unnamed protein product [Thlaspi arvense]